MANQYVFLPWLRRGLASQVKEADPLTGAAIAEKRSSVKVSVKILADDAEKAGAEQQVALLGPGDITGISTSAIVKTDPQAGAKNFEPNYFPYVEFYEEDFIWRYSPAKAAADKRLRPWLTLVVLQETEFERVPQTTGAGNSVIRITANPIASVFPPPSQIWAWGHVQINDGNLLTAEMANADTRNQKIASSLNANPNLGVCRLLNQRKLQFATTYYAFVIPSFETGRLAGLGAKKTVIDAVSRFEPSWGGATDNDGRYPVYYEWNFHTGTEDFEALAKKISPRDLTGTDIGKLWMDASDINYGSNFDYHGNLEPDKPEQKGFLPFQGALRLPGPQRVNLAMQSGSTEMEFVDRFAKLVNLGIEYRQKPASDLQWGIAALGNDNDDPLLVPPVYGRWYVKPDGNAALDPSEHHNWLEQLNLDPGMRVAAGLGADVIKEHQEEFMSRSWEQLSDYRKQLNSQMHRLRFANEVTKATFLKHFSNDQPLTDQTVNRVLAFTQSVQTFIKSDQPDISVAAKLSISKTDAAFVQPAYRKMTRTGGPVIRKLQTKTTYNSLIMGGNTQFVVLGFFVMVNPQYQNFSAIMMKRVEPNNFTFVPGPWPNVALMLQDPNWFGGQQGMFLVDRGKFPGIARDLLVNLLLKPILSKPPIFDLKMLGQKVLAKITPSISFHAQYQALIPADSPPAVAGSESISPNTFNPFFTDPNFERLAKQRPELFIPNLDKIEANSFVLLQANSAFIESFLVGMNHELGAEFLWRGFPADMNATFFRQFWDVGDVPSTPQRPDKSDIVSIRTWDFKSLGTNGPAGSFTDPLVFVIKADLVKKYPNLVVYAQKAVLKPDGRVPDLTTAPLMPIFLSHLGPDFLFAGFELTKEKVLGLPAAGPADKDGWYFVIGERPGEMHFGLDQDRRPNLPYATWNDLAWTDLPPDIVCLDLDKHIPPSPAARNGLEWGKGQAAVTADPVAGTGDAAQMAAILQQRPVQIFIHASQLVK